jgi:hypothetical protein
MNAGTQMESPAMVAAVGLPLRCERGAHGSGGVQHGEAVEDEATRNAVGLLPWVAFDLDAKRAAVVRPRTGQARQSQRCEKQANCKSP